MIFQVDFVVVGVTTLSRTITQAQTLELGMHLSRGRIGYSELLQFFRGNLYAALNTFDPQGLRKDFVQSCATQTTLEQYASKALVEPNQ
jgi:hypothetical protein